MNTFVVLLRGINVGGNNPLPMSELVDLLESLGCSRVKTYIQSGNVALESGATPTRLADEIAHEIKRRHGYEPIVVVLNHREFEAAMAANPYPEATADPKSLHLGFMASTPVAPNLEKLENLRAGTERFQVIGNVFYLHAPDGVGRSKLAAGSESCLGVPTTNRNWRTVCKINDMAAQLIEQRSSCS